MKKSAPAGMMGRLVFWIKRCIVTVLLLWSTAIVLFAFLPVPFSAVMLEKQLSALLSGDFFLRCASDMGVYG